MPELPEVETIRRQLAPAVEGRVVTGLDILDARLTAPVPAAEIRRQVEGRRIDTLSRRGKYLRFELAGGGTLVLHLRMTGRLTLVHADPRGTQTSGPEAAGNAVDPKHLRLIIELDNGSCVAFHDTRRFGTAIYLHAEEEADFWDRLGPEPLERSFNPASLMKICSGRKKAVKSALMDQKLIAGIGNIYADESLFRAGIHPERPAGELSYGEIELLCREIKSTLRHAIKLQGSSIDTYADTSGQRGGFQETFKVHRRGGEPCPACGTTIEKIRVGGRGTYYCPKCQK